MKYGKRQLILASLVLALGAAVYLNWQFAGTKVQSAGDVSEESASSALGAAQLVNNAYVETVSPTRLRTRTAFCRKRSPQTVRRKAARQKKQRLRYRFPQSFRTPA
mgnify:CR=1 FL=1